VRYAEARKEEEFRIQQALRQGAGVAAAGAEPRTGEELRQGAPADGCFPGHRHERLALPAEPAAGIISVLEDPFDGQRPAPDDEVGMRLELFAAPKMLEVRRSDLLCGVEHRCPRHAACSTKP
jgi:hypothetical protein